MKKNIVTIIFIFSIITFIVITSFVLTAEVLAIDTIVREYIYSFRSITLTYILIGITFLGNWQTIGFICFILLLYKHTRFSYGIPLSSAALISSLLKDILKGIFLRERPDLYLHLIQQGGYSYPSGHSMISLVFYGMIISICKQKIKNRTVLNTVTILLAVLIILIGFSRIYLGVHYPSDVLGGWSIGICIYILLSTFNFSLQRKI